MESLNANISNIWYPVADALRDPGQPIYSVTKAEIYNMVGSVLTLGLLIAGAVVLMRRRGLSETELAVALWGYAAVVFRMTLTHVHVNHLFFGALLAVVLLPLVCNRWFSAAVQVLLLLQFVNVAGRYGSGLNKAL